VNVTVTRRTTASASTSDKHGATRVCRSCRSTITISRRYGCGPAAGTSSGCRTRTFATRSARRFIRSPYETVCWDWTPRDTCGTSSGTIWIHSEWLMQFSRTPLSPVRTSRTYDSCVPAFNRSTRQSAVVKKYQADRRQLRLLEVLGGGVVTFSWF